jgi:ABC-type transport system involved in multi-copper enzyme maturation permease subunit
MMPNAGQLVREEAGAAGQSLREEGAAAMGAAASSRNDRIASGPSPSSPFGWTGVRRERYTRWNGRLDGRKRIVQRMITEGVRFNAKTWPVIILLALAWMVTVFFPVLFASMGGLALESNNVDTWTGAESTQAGMHLMVTNDSVAEFQLRGAQFTNRTRFDVINVPLEWSAYVNASVSGGTTAAMLFVIPATTARPMTYAGLRVQATTGQRVDSFTALTTIAPDNLTASLGLSYSLDLSAGSFEGKAGATVGIRFNVTNTGTLPDSYNISVSPLAPDWGISAYIDGAKVPVKTCETAIQNGRGPNEFGRSVKVRYFQLDLSPGETARCEARVSTKTDSARLNYVNIAINSRQDPAVFGSYPAQVNLSDTKKVDLTGDILYGQVASTQVFFALLLAAVVGSRMISTDLWEKSYNLYFARPLTKTDYIAGKFGTVGVILGMATIVPTLVTYSFLLLLSNISSTYVVDHLWVWGAIIGQGLVVVLTFSTLSLAFSSLTARRFYAAAAMVVIYLVTTILGQIVMGAFESKYGRLIGINDNFDVVGRTAYGIADNIDWGFSWYYSLAVLAAIWAVCTFLVWYRIDRTELSE